MESDQLKQGNSSAGLVVPKKSWDSCGSCLILVDNAGNLVIHGFRL